MHDIPRETLDALVGDGPRPAAVLVTLPERDDPDLTVRGVTVLHRRADGLAVTAHLLVLHDGTYMEDGSAGGWVLDDSDFLANLVYETSPRPVDEAERVWRVPRIEATFGPGGAVAARVLLRTLAAAETTDGPLPPPTSLRP